MSVRRRVRALAAAPLLLVTAGALPPPSAFHTRLTAAYPAPDAAHEAPIHEVRLRFSTAVQPSLSAITVHGPGGTVEAGPVETVAGSEATELRVRLPRPLDAGAYTVEWRTAGPDSHVLEGSYGFSVAGGPPAAAQGPPAPPAPQDTETVAAPGEQTLELVPTDTGEEGPRPSVREIATGWIFLVSLVGMIGTVGFRLAVVGPFGAVEEQAEAGARARRGTAFLAALAVGLGFVALPMRLLVQAGDVAGPEGSTLAAAGRLLGTPWGSAWILQGSGIVLFLVGLLVGRGKPEARGPWLVSGLGAALVALVPGLSGHAAASGAALVGLDLVHVLAAGTWLGGLACLVLVGIPATARPGEPLAVAPLVARFSALALPAVAVLMLTGVANAVDRVTLGELFSSAYGRTLLLKLVVAGGAFSLGFYNWRVVRPALEQGGTPGLLRIPATLELVAGLLVLVITAALIATGLP